MKNAIRFWACMTKEVLLPALLTLSVLITPAIALPRPFGLGYLLVVAAILAWVTWQTVVNDRPPKLLRRAGF